MLLWASKFVLAKIECSFEIIIEPTEIMQLSNEKSHSEGLPLGEFQNFEKAFDCSLPITVSNKKEVFKLWWVRLT